MISTAAAQLRKYSLMSKAFLAKSGSVDFFASSRKLNLTVK